MTYKLLWTDEAIRNLEQILQYLAVNWTDKEVNNFKLKLSEQLNIISKFPTIFPVSPVTPRSRKAVLTKQTIIFYEIKEQAIYIVYLFDTRQNPERIKQNTIVNNSSNKIKRF